MGCLGGGGRRQDCWPSVSFLSSSGHFFPLHWARLVSSHSVMQSAPLWAAVTVDQKQENFSTYASCDALFSSSHSKAPHRGLLSSTLHFVEEELEHSRILQIYIKEKRLLVTSSSIELVPWSCCLLEKGHCFLQSIRKGILPSPFFYPALIKSVQFSCHSV